MRCFIWRICHIWSQIALSNAVGITWWNIAIVRLIFSIQVVSQMPFRSCRIAGYASCFFPIADYGYPPCGVIGLQCLSYFNCKTINDMPKIFSRYLLIVPNIPAILTYDKPRIVSPFFSQSEDGIDCKCLPECIRIEYKYTVKPNYMW